MASSTAGYLHEIGILQFRQRARSRIQLSSGMLSYQPMVVWHSGQRERGLLMLLCFGRREMQTFRKLPRSKPRANTATSKAIGASMRIQYRVAFAFPHPVLQTGGA